MATVEVHQKVIVWEVRTLNVSEDMTPQELQELIDKSPCSLEDLYNSPMVIGSDCVRLEDTEEVITTLLSVNDENIKIWHL